MIDSIKFLIPIPDTLLLSTLEGSLTRFKKEDLRKGTTEFEFYSSQIEVGSYNRTISLKSTKQPHGLFLEFSVAKYAKGNNVEMLLPSQVPDSIEKLYFELCQYLNHDLPHFSTWPIYRLDICYNWILKDQEAAIQAMDFIKLIDYPRKKKHTWDTSVMFQGSAYTIKFYRKGPEFLKHDFNKIPYERATELQYWANRIVRFEIAIKRHYLQSFLGLKTVYLEHIVDNEVTEETLRHYLDCVFRYINRVTMRNADIKEILSHNFTRQKATRLYQFYKNYYYDEDLKNMIKKGTNRSTIYRYKKDLQRVGIGFTADITDTTNKVLDMFIIPSPDSKFDLPAPEYYS